MIDTTTAINAIQGLMDGQEWDAETLDAIAGLVRATGREIRDSGEFEDEK